MRTAFVLTALAVLPALPLAAATHTPCSNEEFPSDVPGRTLHLASVGVDTGYPTQYSVTVCVEASYVALNNNLVLDAAGGAFGDYVNPTVCPASATCVAAGNTGAVVDVSPGVVVTLYVAGRAIPITP